MLNKISIATGKSRFDKSWKNTELHWDTLVDRLRKTKRTDELYSDYLKMSKDKQGDVKDVGGFVGGIVTGGRRIIGKVNARYLITLDIDFAPYDVWEDLTLMYDNEMVLYSTHKHSKETPRYRLIMPLDREVMADEYEAISRRLAGDISIEIFDPTTFQPERLMYWPSTSKDGEYIFKHQKGPWISADA